MADESHNRVNILYSYVVATDSGFAPNPYFGVCTLACCKPALRRAIGRKLLRRTGLADVNQLRRSQPDQVRRQGIWIVGLAGSRLTDRPYRSVVFVMQVTEVLDFESYFEDYPRKRPIRTTATSAADAAWHGDAIYTGNDPATAHQVTPCAHSRGHAEDPVAMRHDLGGRYVLVSDHFIYFGAAAQYLELESELHHGRGHRATHSAETLAEFESQLNGPWRGLFEAQLQPGATSSVPSDCGCAVRPPSRPECTCESEPDERTGCARSR